MAQYSSAQKRREICYDVRRGAIFDTARSLKKIVVDVYDAESRSKIQDPRPHVIDPMLTDDPSWLSAVCHIELPILSHLIICTGCEVEVSNFYSATLRFDLI